MYREGRGVPQDAGEALRWFRLAAEQGHATAQYNLWFMYERGSSRIPCSPTCGSTSVAQTERRLPGDRGTPLERDRTRTVPVHAFTDLF